MQSLRVFLNSSQTWKLNSLQSVPNSVGHMGTTTVMQPNAIVSEFTWVFTLNVCTQCLKHLTVMVNTDLLLFDLKSSSRGPSVSKNIDTYDVIFFRPGEVGCPRCTPAVFLWVQNGETTPHHLPQYAEELHHQYGKDPIFQQQWNVFASRCEIQQEYTWWYPWLHTTACTVTINSTDSEQMVWHLCTLHSILNLCTVLQSSDSASMSSSWYVHQLLPAHLQHLGPIHPCCLQHTCCTAHNAHPPAHFSRLTFFCSKNPCPLVLSRYHHYLVHCVVKSVLATHSADCKVLYTCLPVFTKSNVHCTIYTSKAVLQMGFSWTSLIITSHKSTWNDMTIYLCKQHSKTLLILTPLI